MRYPPHRLKTIRERGIRAAGHLHSVLMAAPFRLTRVGGSFERSCAMPCSGLGIIQQKAGYSKDAREFAALPEIQRAILSNSARYVQSGWPSPRLLDLHDPARENERVTDDFLSAHPEFTYESFSLPNGESCREHITLWPQRSNGRTDFISAA